MRKILISLVVLVIAGFVLINIFASLLLAKAVEKAVGAPVSVGSVRIDWAAAAATVRDLKIHNPQGFQSGELALIPELRVDLEPRALLNQKIRLTELRLDLDQVTVERNRDGRINLLELGVMKEMLGPKPAAAQPKPAEPARPEARAKGKAFGVQIDQAVVSLGRARYVESAPPVEKQVALNVKGEVLHNLTDPRYVTRDIVILVLKRVGMAEIASRFDVLLQGLGTEARTKLAPQMQGALTELSHRVKVFGGESPQTT